MIIDTSAVVAIVLREPGWERVVDALESAGTLGIGAPSLTEASLVLGGRLGRDPKPKLARLLQEYSVEVLPYAQEHYAEAVEAFLRYGKGRHPAALNFGDCMAYAVAKLSGQPLLALGGDFVRTDIELVPLV